MSDIIKIDGNTLTTDNLITYLKLTNEFDSLTEKLIRHQVTVLAAKKKGIQVSETDVQDAADNFRRYAGLHRAKDTMEWLEAQKLTVDDLETFITGQLFAKKALEEVTTDAKIEEYFQLNSPKFDTVDIKHLVVEGKNQANELMAQLQDEPGLFDEFVRDYCLDDETKRSNGLIAGIRRGSLEPDVEAKVFNGKEGDVLGPFQLGGEDLHEIVTIVKLNPASLDESTRVAIGETLYEEWLEARMEEFSISAD